jgi:hypothetical protein
MTCTDTFQLQEEFYIRDNFAKTVATSSCCQYVLGIGDRHDGNLLIHTPSGRLVPIDFGHAFGTATQLLPVPELMPMRLTRQVSTHHLHSYYATYFDEYIQIFRMRIVHNEDPVYQIHALSISLCHLSRCTKNRHSCAPAKSQHAKLFLVVYASFRSNDRLLLFVSLRP